MEHKFVAKRFWKQSAGLTLDTDALYQYNDVIDLSIGDLDQTTDEAIIEAAFQDARKGYTHYGDPHGDPELIAAIQENWKKEHGQTLRGDELIVATSGCLGLATVFMAILNPGDEVIVFSPYFPPYRSQAEMAGGTVVEVPTYEKDGYLVTRENLEAAITPHTRAIVLNNPVNPTGAFYDEKAMTMIADICKKYDLILVADEVYTDFIFDGNHYIPMRTLPGMAERTITLNSFSKNYLMTGWRIGYIIADPAIISTIGVIKGSYTYSTPSISQRAAIKALSMHEEIRAKYIPIYAERVAYSTERIQKIPYMTLYPSKGTFYSFPGIEKTGLTSPEFCQELTKRAHILVTPGHVFGSTGAGHIRISNTVSMEKLKEAYDRMEQLKF